MSLPNTYLVKVKELEAYFRPALAANEKKWNRMARMLPDGAMDELTYDGDAVDEAFRVLKELAVIIKKTNQLKEPKRKSAANR